MGLKHLGKNQIKKGLDVLDYIDTIDKKKSLNLRTVNGVLINKKSKDTIGTYLIKN